MVCEEQSLVLHCYQALRLVACSYQLLAQCVLALFVVVSFEAVVDMEVETVVDMVVESTKQRDNKVVVATVVVCTTAVQV